MKGLWLTLAIPLAVAQSPLEPPRAGCYRDRSGLIAVLEGVAGAWRATAAGEERVLGAACTERAAWHKSAEELVVAGSGGGSTWATPGRALGSFTAAGEPFAFWLEESAEVVVWEAGFLRRVARVEKVAAVGPASADASGIRVVSGAAGQWTVTDLDLRSGGVCAQWPVETAGAVAVSPAGEILSVAGDSLEWLDGESWLVRANGQVAAWRPGSQPVPVPLDALPALQLFWRDGAAGESPVGAEFAMPAAAPGDSATARFRIRNSGTAALEITRLSIDPGPFKTVDQFFPPYTVAPGGWADFSVRFAPAVAGEYASTLWVNTLKVTLRGSSQAAPELEMEAGGQWTRLDPAAVQTLGPVTRGAAIERRLRLAPPAGPATVMEPPALTGQKFALEAAGGLEFVLRFSADAAGVYPARITAGGRSYSFEARVVEFTLPKATLEPSSGEAQPAASIRVALRLAQAAQADYSGTLRVAFQSAVAGVTTDPAVVLLPGQKPAVAFKVRAGATGAEFEDGSDTVQLQTGTTAGVITLSAVVDQQQLSQTLRVAPAPPGLVSGKAAFSTTSAEVTLTGFDNTRTASRVAFTFRLKSGEVAAPGRIEADVGGLFKSYFTDNAAAAGTFRLRASFPVSGSAELLDSVEIEMTNSSGAIRTTPLRFE